MTSKHCFGRVHCPLAEYMAKRCSFMSAGTEPPSLGAPVSKILGGNVALLQGLAVAERARRAGLAAPLVSALVAEVRLGGIESLVVRTETAAGCFSRLGFTPVDGAATQELLAFS